MIGKVSGYPERNRNDRFERESCENGGEVSRGALQLSGYAYSLLAKVRRPEITAALSCWRLPQRFTISEASFVVRRQMLGLTTVLTA